MDENDNTTSTLDVLEPLNAVKVIKQDDKTVTVGGYGVVFDGQDLEAETFTKDTDFMLDLVPEKLVLYDHGQNRKIGRKIGHVSNENIRPDDVGLWIQGELDKSAQYIDGVMKLIDEGVLGWSSGSVAHLTRRDNGVIKSWPIVEFSLTPTPAEPRTLGVELIKKLAKTDESLKAFLPESGQETASEDATAADGGAKDVVDIIDEGTMSENEAAPVPVLTADAIGEAVGAQLNNFQKGLSDNLTEFLEQIANRGELKDAGYVAPDSETDHAETKSFGDWLLAVKNNNTKRLKEVYKSQKALAEGSGTSGGYLVPEEFQARLMAIADANGIIRPRASVIPVGSESGVLPALDISQDLSSTTGATAFAGGVVASWGAEAASLTATEPKFNLVKWNIHKLQGYTQASNELVADSAIGIEALLTALFGRAVASMEDYAFINGTGAGEPLGILKSGAAIGVTTTTNDQFKIEDAMKMYGQFQSVGGSPVWILNPALTVDLYSYFSVSTGGTDFIQPREGVPMSLLGFPILFSEHMPAANTDDAMLVDLAAYLVLDRAGMAIAYSEHAAFTTDQATWRFTKRLDGQPWMRSYVTLADGSHTVSPFVYHND